MDAETAQERRERSAAYSRAYRARKRAEAAEQARVAADGEPGPMRQAVDASIGAAKWITGADAASITQAQRLADITDRTEDIRLEIRAHSLLGRILADMGLTPRVRMQLELRARKLDTANAEKMIDDQPNVTRIASPRPPKRQR